MAVREGSSFGVGAILDGKRNDEDDYFKILGCSETSTDEQINAEYRLRALQCHPDKHPGDEKALQQFQRLQEAKDTLLDPEKRQKYDRWKQSQMSISYKQWLGISGRCATTMHWAKPKEQTMLESCSDHTKKTEQSRHLEDQRTPSSSSARNNSQIPGSSADVSQQQEPLVWRPADKSSSIYSKFRNYQI